MGKIIAISNQKGGVGKTTTAMNLSTGLAACGKKVLVVDLDPQGNTTTGFGIEKVSNEFNSYTLILGDAPAERTVHTTMVPNLHIIPSTIHLSGAEVELVPALAREYKLRDALKSVYNNYDYVFIDCPPSLGLITLNALSACDEVLIPLQCEFFAMEGLSQLFQTIDLVKKNLNTKMQIMGVLLTMYDSRNKLSKLVESDVREYLGERVLKTVIPRNVRVSEAPSHGKPVLLYDIACPGSKAYMSLAAEVIGIEKKRQPAVNVGVAA